jgi:hypothetical protein
MLLPTLVQIQEEIMKIKEKDVSVIYLIEPLNERDIQELENAFHRLIAQLPFSLTKEIRRRLEKIERILRKEESLRDIADEIKRYKGTIRGDDIRLPIGERVVMLERIEKWRKNVRERLSAIL